MLAAKIDATLTNTLPLWQQRFAEAVMIYRSGSVASQIKAVVNPRNVRLEKNTESYGGVKTGFSRLMEGGIVDIESLEEATDIVITTIEESLQVAEQGKQHRLHALIQMQSVEEELHSALESAKIRSQEIVGGTTVEINIED